MNYQVIIFFVFIIFIYTCLLINIIYDQIQIPVPQSTGGSANNMFDAFLSVPSMNFDLKHGTGNHFEAARYPSHGMFSAEGMQQECLICNANNGILEFAGVQSGGGDTLPNTLYAKWQHDMFYFSAQRPANGETGHGYADRLDAAANNLPNVLNTLRGERDDVYQQLVGHLREVFPTIGNMSVRTRPDNNLEVLLWPTEKMDELPLSFPLKNSGTGVAQVIAMFTAIMTVKNAVIIIDEINSFLHPAAVKAVLRILQTEYGQHQYIVSTQAPEVISFSNPRTIHLVTRSKADNPVTGHPIDQGLLRCPCIQRHEQQLGRSRERCSCTSVLSFHPFDQSGIDQQFCGASHRLAVEPSRLAFVRRGTKLDRHQCGSMETSAANRIGDHLAHNHFVVVLILIIPLILSSIDYGDCSQHGHRKRGASRFPKIISLVEPCPLPCFLEARGALSRHGSECK